MIKQKHHLLNLLGQGLSSNIKVGTGMEYLSFFARWTQLQALLWSFYKRLMCGGCSLRCHFTFCAKLNPSENNVVEQFLTLLTAPWLTFEWDRADGCWLSFNSGLLVSSLAWGALVAFSRAELVIAGTDAFFPLYFSIVLPSFTGVFMYTSVTCL